MNTNMFLESIHKTINYCVKGRKHKRMDKCINDLLKFIRGKTFKRFIRLAKNKHSCKKDIIVYNHKLAVDELKDGITGIVIFPLVLFRNYKIIEFMLLVFQILKININLIMCTFTF